MFRAILLVFCLLPFIHGTHRWTKVEESENSDHLTLKFTVNGQDVLLDMQRNTHVENVPLFLGVDGNILKAPENDFELRAYTNPLSGETSVLKIRKLTNGVISKEFRASFHLKGKEYSLEPQQDEAFGAHNQHIVTDQTVNGDMDDYEGIIRPEMDHSVQEMNRLKKDNLLSQTPLTKANYGIEMLLCLDYPIYKRWLEKCGSREKAIENIKYFYTHIVNSIDSRYMSIKESDFGMYVRLKAIYIATTIKDSPWTEKTKYPGGSRGFYTHAYDTLDDFEIWINTPAVNETIGHFDQATLYTGYTLIGGFRDDGSPRRILGLAGIRSICEYRRCSVNQENGQYATTQTGAHEMAHNLGSLHDGNKDNTCLSKDQFVMAISPGNLDEKNYKNTFTFSRCSREYFRDWLSYLTLKGKNCLLDNAKTELPGWDKNLKTLPGQKYSYDEQCIQQKGRTSYYCAGQPNDKKMCHELECYDPALKRCVHAVEQRAYIGTTCGNKKWCDDEYFCMKDSRAPSAKDHCLSGDYRMKLQSSTGVSRTCKEIGEKEPYDCYKRHNQTCCHTCDTIRDTSKPGCEFGDHTPYCKIPSDIRLRDCYGDRTRLSCCKSCKPLDGASKGCEFGDRASWCEDMRLGACYVSEETCCKKCKDNEDKNKPACRWGDKASWCNKIEKKSCYSLNGTCCATCPKYHTKIPGCAYGDRSRSCSADDCNDKKKWKKCCQTCRSKIEACEGGDTASWCPTSHPSICYKSWDICCTTCKKHYTGDINCPYGDRFSWCPGYVNNNKGICKSNPDVARDCCLTCAKK